MNRRAFCRSAVIPFAASSVATGARADDALDELRKQTVTKVTGFRHEAARRHAAGKSARGDALGATVSEGVLRVATDAGLEGFGLGTAEPGHAKSLLGKTLADFWKPGLGVVSPLGRSDHALYDLVGKALDRPVSALLGGMGPDWVPVLDGSVYFDDLMPREAHGRTGVPRLLAGVEQSLKAGYRSFLIRVGRGHRWMDPDAGFRRDVEVVKAVRAAAGKASALAADADHAYDLETAERWLDAVGGELLFASAMFPAQVDRDLLLKQHLRGRRLATLVADGTGADDLDDFDSLVKHEALDVYRPDATAWGLTRLCALARKLSAVPRLRLAPANPGSFLGLYLQLAVARAVPNVLTVEAAPCESDLFDASAYVFYNGKLRVPNVAGFGLTLREDVYRDRYAKGAWVVE